MQQLRVAMFAVVFGAIVATWVSAQAQKPATMDDLVAEVRALRAEINRVAGVSMRAQLLTARLGLQEGRINALSQQLASVRQESASLQASLVPLAAQVKQFPPDADDPVFAPIGNMVRQMQQRDQELRAQQAELEGLIAAEQNRWIDFNSRLDEIERTLPVR